MHTLLWRAWDVLGGVATPKLVTREMAVLLILAASLLVFRTLRERCLLVWMVGWIAYLISNHALIRAASDPSPYAVPMANAEFMLAVLLFVAGSLIYANGRDVLAPVLAIGLTLIAFAGLRGIYWPDSVTLRFALELSYRILTVSAAIWVLRFRRARREVGPWVLAVGLLLLHQEWWPLSRHLPAGAGLFSDIVLGVGMLLVVFDQSRLYTRRLATLNALTTTIARAGQNGPVTATALEQLKELIGAKAAWLRLMNGQRLTIFQQTGLSPQFLEERASVK